MSAIQCLVTYGTHKIVVTVDGEHRRPDLIRCLAQKQVFEGVDLEPSHIMVSTSISHISFCPLYAKCYECLRSKLSHKRLDSVKCSRRCLPTLRFTLGTSEATARGPYLLCFWSLVQCVHCFRLQHASACSFGFACTYGGSNSRCHCSLFVRSIRVSRIMMHVRPPVDAYGSRSGHPGLRGVSSRTTHKASQDFQIV